MEEEKKPQEWIFTPEDELTLHQLFARKEWVEKLGDKSNLSELNGSLPGGPNNTPVFWKLADSIQLYSWQKECIDLWVENGCKGTVKVVTGAGKTFLALGILQKLQNDIENDLYVAVVVPTIVLMNQWFDEIISSTNIPGDMIGFLGGGYDDSFTKNKRILLCVLNSAQKKLPSIVEKWNCGDKLLLIVDECHRAGASVMKNIFDTERRYSLGLSATPEREEDQEPSEQLNIIESSEYTADEPYDDSLLGKELGSIIYELNLEDAFKMGIIPPYEINHYGLPLSPNERQRYELLNKEIKDLRDKLWKIALSKNILTNGDFIRWCNRSEGSDSEGRQKRLYLSRIRERKSLLYKAESRSHAVITLLKEEFKENSRYKAILFHEDIDEAMDLWAKLIQSGVSAVPENSKLSEGLRKKSIELFRKGTANVLVSVKSLVEGFNVPSADLGIVVASSTSSRQRIQTLGRLLRKHRTVNGEEKNSKIYVLYIENTVDELTYTKTDWDSLTGAERNNYFKWNPDPLLELKPEIQREPPARPLPSDNEIDASSLKPGDLYLGKYEGLEFTADADGNVFLGGQKDHLIANPQGVPEQILKAKGGFGKFKLTPTKNYVLVNTFTGEDWITKYVMTLENPFLFIKMEGNRTESDYSKLQPGDEIEDVLFDVLIEYGYKKKSGRDVITKKVKRGEIYAYTSINAKDKSKGAEAERLMSDISITEKKIGEKISKIKLSKDNVAYVFKKGKVIFVSKLNNELEFDE